MKHKELSDQQIILKIKKLHSIKPRTFYSRRVDTVLLPALPTKHKGVNIFRFFTTQFIAIALIVIMILGSAGRSFVFAADISKPGELLYPVKRVIEEIHIVIEFDSLKKAQLHMKYADRRVGELQEAIDTGVDDTIIESIIVDYENHIYLAKQKVPKGIGHDDLALFVDNSIKKNILVLQRVHEKVPEVAKPAIERAIESTSSSQKKNTIQNKKVELQTRLEEHKVDNSELKDKTIENTQEKINDHKEEPNQEEGDSSIENQQEDEDIEKSEQIINDAYETIQQTEEEISEIEQQSSIKDRKNEIMEGITNRILQNTR
ncbi:DUF5667 domain-containing protein [Patescibacteria group bacterium]